MFFKKTCLICPKVKTYLKLISWRKILQYELRLILVGSYQNISQERSRCSVVASPEREREKRNNGKLTVTVILNSLRTVDSGEQITVLSRYNTEVVQLLLNWKRTKFSFPRANMRAIPEAWSGLGWVTSSKIFRAGERNKHARVLALRQVPSLKKWREFRRSGKQKELPKKLSFLNLSSKQITKRWCNVLVESHLFFSDKTYIKKVSEPFLSPCYTRTFRRETQFFHKPSSYIAYL